MMKLTGIGCEYRATAQATTVSGRRWRGIGRHLYLSGCGNCTILGHGFLLKGSKEVRGAKQKQVPNGENGKIARKWEWRPHLFIVHREPPKQSFCYFPKHTYLARGS